MGTQRLPAEFEEHETTIIEWPYDEELQRTQSSIAKAIAALVEMEHVYVLTGEYCEDTIKAIRKSLTRQGIEKERIHISGIQEKRLEVEPNHLPGHIYITPNILESGWLRDTAPLTVLTDKGAREMMSFDKNKKDHDLVQDLARMANIPLRRTNSWLEGGAIDVNGKGTALLSTEGLYKPGRGQPEEIIEMIRQNLAIQKIIEVDVSIAGDGCKHVDLSARFVTPTKILCSVENDSTLQNYHQSQALFERLRDETTSDGEKIEVQALPFPKPLIEEGILVPASYANFYIGNGTVVVPQFGGKNKKKDREAMEVIGAVFPDRTLVPFPSKKYAELGGGFHCLTMHIADNLKS